MTLHAPPKPDWHGFDSDLLDKYVAFVVNQTVERRSETPRRLRCLLDDAKDGASYYRADIEARRRRITESEERLARLCAIRDNQNDDDLVANLARVVALPYVTGTRSDRYGRLVVQLRITKEYEGVLYDLGDYDVVMAQYHSSAVRASVTRCVENITSYLDYFTWDDREYGVLTGGVRLRMDNLATCFESGDFLTVVEAAHAALTQVRTQALRTVMTDPQPEALWDGFIPSPLKAAKRSMAIWGNRDNTLEYRIRYEERSIANHERELENNRESLRDRNAAIRKLTAELAQAETEVGEVEIDHDAVANELKFITALPGVVGMKFNSAGVPVLLVRTSVVVARKRYDLGDFELTFTPNEESLGVLTTTCTREVEHNPYWTTFRYSGGKDGWFCFGGRSGDLLKLFRGGHYGPMVHMMLNSMNHLNADDTSRYTVNRLTPIPLGAVWSSKPRRPRRRPRRPREVVA